MAQFSAQLRKSADIRGQVDRFSHVAFPRIGDQAIESDLMQDAGRHSSDVSRSQKRDDGNAHPKRLACSCMPAPGKCVERNVDVIVEAHVSAAAVQGVEQIKAMRRDALVGDVVKDLVFYFALERVAED